jgi:hypothetical protein
MKIKQSMSKLIHRFYSVEEGQRIPLAHLRKLLFYIGFHDPKPTSIVELSHKL